MLQHFTEHELLIIHVEKKSKKDVEIAVLHGFTIKVKNLGEDGLVAYRKHRPKKRLLNALLKTK